MSVRTVVNSFNAGELSPRMLARPEVDAYSRGCRILENFIPTDYGAVERRPGIRFAASLSKSGARIFPFVFNDDNAYVVAVMPDGAVNVCPSGFNTFASVSVQSGAALPSSLDPWKIQTTQSADVLYMVSPEFAPRCLKRNKSSSGGVGFQLSLLSFEFPPALDLYTGNAEIKCSQWEAGQTGATLTATSALFDSSDVGRTFTMTFRRGNSNSVYATGSKFKDGTKKSEYGWVSVYGAWTYSTRGTWVGTIDIYRRYGKPGYYDTPQEDDLLYHYESQRDFNLSLSGDESDRDAYYYFKWSLVWSGATLSTATDAKIGYTFTNPGYEKTGVVRVSAVSSSVSATCDVLSDLLESGIYTDTFRRGAFCDADGYPAAVAIFQERLFLGGTAKNPNRMWGSRTNDWDDFMPAGNEDDGALDFTLSSGSVCRVCWMASFGGALLVGTTEDEWEVTGGSRNDPLTASSLLMKRNSAYGSAFPSSCVMAQDMLLFVQKDGRRLRALRYSWESDSYGSDDLTLLSRHVFDDHGVKEISLQRFPDTVLWALRSDGVVCSATINTSQNVTGWARHPTATPCGSFCVLPGPDGTDVRTALFGKTMGFMDAKASPGAVCLDLYAPVYRKVQSENLGPYWLLGNSLDYVSPLSGASLPTESAVLLLSDGRVLDCSKLDPSALNFQLDSGELKETPEGSPIGWLGLPYSSVLSPMPAEFAGQDGHSLLRKKTINRVLVDKYDSRGGELRCNAGKWIPLDDRRVSDDVDEAAPTRTEAVVSAPMGGNARRVWVEIRTSSPFPLNVAAVSQVISTEDA